MTSISSSQSPPASTVRTQGPADQAGQAQAQQAEQAQTQAPSGAAATGTQQAEQAQIQQQRGPADGVEQHEDVQARKDLWKLDAGKVRSGPRSKEEVDKALEQQLAQAEIDDETAAQLKQEMMQAGVSFAGGVSQTLGKGSGSTKADLGPGKHVYGTDYRGSINPKLQSSATTPGQLAHTHKQLDAQLAKEYPNGVSFKPPFKPPTSAAAAHAKWALLHVPKQVGREGDHIVNLNGKKTLMTVRAEVTTVEQRKGTKVIKKRGAAATVEIGGTNVPKLAKTFKDVDEARKALKKDFGVELEKPTQFNPEQLGKIHLAFSKLSKAEQGALQGVKLEHHTRLGNNRAAEFHWKEEPSGKAPNVTHTSEKVMRVTPSAFAADGTRFVGDHKSPTFPSVRTILHEAGHAIDSQLRRTTLHDRVKAETAFQNAAHTTAKANRGWRSAYGKLPKKSPQRAAAKSFDRASKEVQRRIDLLRRAKPNQVQAHAQALSKAQKQRDQALAALKGTPLHAKAKQLADERDKLGKAVGDVVKAVPKEVEHRTKKTRGTTKDSKGNPIMKSKRLARFDAYVKRHKIKPFTDYAASFHKKGGDEFYAEALSLFKTDPKWMQANSPQLYNYFAQGQHLQE